jgi:hypothetical protein
MIHHHGHALGDEKKRIALIHQVSSFYSSQQSFTEENAIS